MFLCLSPVFPNKQGTSESGTGPEPGYNHCANVDHSSLVPQIATPFDRLPSYYSKGTNNTAPSFQSGESSSSSQETHPSGVQIIRNSLTARGISQKAAKVILQSWRESTQTIFRLPQEIPSTSGNGCCFAVQGVLIHTKQLQHKR